MNAILAGLDWALFAGWLLVFEPGRPQPLVQCMRLVGRSAECEATEQAINLGFYAGGDEAFRQSHVALVGDSRDRVDAFHAAGVASGGTSLDGPRLRPEFGGLSSAYLADPDGKRRRGRLRPVVVSDRSAGEPVVSRG
jgi:hypothetical protein